MQKLYHIIFITFIIFCFLTGCSTTRYVYVYPELPDLKEQPQGQEYKLKMVKINNINYYCLTPNDSKILVENWLNYKNWSEINYEILKKYKEEREKSNEF